MDDPGVVDQPVSGGTEHSLIKALRTVPDFVAFDDATMLEVVGCSMNLRWLSGSLVFEKDLPAEALFIVLSGSVEIYEVVDGSEERVTIVSAGDYFGELSVLMDATHSKHARVLEDAELLSIPKASFQELVQSNEELAGYLRKRLKERLPGGGPRIERLLEANEQS